MKDLKQFLNDVKAQLITEEGIRSFLLSLNNEEFIELLSNHIDNDTEGIADVDIERMTQNHAIVISEIIADLTLEEKLKSLSNISNDFYTVEKMIFKTLPFEKAVELFSNNPNKYKEEIEVFTDEYIKEENCPEKILNSSVEYSLLAGGKRLRPVLILSVYGLFKENIEEAFPFAVAMEMIHTFSLFFSACSLKSE